MTSLHFPQGSTHISCADCSMAASSACGDCIVTFLCEGPASKRNLELDQAEARTLSLFTSAGLAPELRHRPRPPASVTFITRRAG